MTDSKKNTVTFSRRNFLKVSTLASGGMLIGFNILTACKPNSSMPINIEDLNFNDFNAFIKIADNGMVTIFSPNPEIGQGVKTSMPMIIAEELDIPWKNVVVKQAPLDTKNFKRQIAGGSQSINKSWGSLRKTGATARQMLINAAAAKWNINPNNCTTKEGVITNTSGDSLHYGEVVNQAALLEIPETITLKKPDNFTIIGTNITNVDIDKIITGKPLFGLDYKSKGMYYTTVLRPPAFGQKLISFDASNANQIEGVDQIIQFGNKIAVLAKNTWTALKAKNKIIAQWSTPHNKETTSEIDKQLLITLNKKNLKIHRENGAINTAFAEADTIIERTYESPFLPHNCMEPMNFYAHVTSSKIHLVGPIQTPQNTARRVAKLLNRKQNEIHLEMTRMGGGFGRRLNGDFALEAAEISNATKKPIKLIYSREDDMTAGVYKPAVKYRISASIKDKKITGYHLKEAVTNKNMPKSISNFFPAGCIPNLKIETGRIKSNITTGAWRAPYTNFLAFAEQSFFDDLALELTIDPIQLRLDLLQNFKKKKDKSIQYSPKRMEGVIKLAAKKANWGKTNNKTYQGFSAFYSHNTHVAEIAEIELENNIPIIKKVIVAVDCGIVVNPTGAKNQIEGGVLDGIGHAMYGDLSILDGKPNANNFHKYRLIRMKETPKIETYFIESNSSPTGLGEPGLPPAGGAIANAIKAATGQRLLKQPFFKHLKKA